MTENPFTPIYRACNTGSNADKYEFLKNGGIKTPRYIDLELTNKCNFSCRFCPTGTNSVRRDKGFMSDEVVEALVQSVQKYNIAGVRFSRWGEPTFHPQWLDIIEKFKKTGAMVHLNTNGSLITESDIKRMIDMEFDSIKFSFQGTDGETYNQMRKGGDYDKLLAKLKLLHSLREAQGQKNASNELLGGGAKPFIQVSTTLTGETADQINSFKSDIQDICDYFNVGYTKLTHLNVNNMNIPDSEKDKIRQLQQHETNPHKRHTNCMEAFDKLSVNWNGDVTLCCGDFDNFMIVGNVLDNDLGQIFLSKAADRYRKIIAADEHKRIHICSTCYELTPLTK